MSTTQNDEVKFPETKKSFQNLWVAGTLGAYFSAFIVNISTDIQQISSSFSIRYTIEVFAPYVYLIWFLTYFFISNLGNTSSLYVVRKWDLPFDIGQSVLALSSAFFLGLLGSNSAKGYWPFIICNLSIFLICFFSHMLFKDREDSTNVNNLRKSGAWISIVTLILLGIFCFFRFLDKGILPHIISLVSIYFLFKILYQYACIRIGKIQ